MTTPAQLQDTIITLKDRLVEAELALAHSQATVEDAAERAVGLHTEVEQARLEAAQSTERIDHLIASNEALTERLIDKELEIVAGRAHQLTEAVRRGRTEQVPTDLAELRSEFPYPPEAGDPTLPQTPTPPAGPATEIPDRYVEAYERGALQITDEEG